jgi:oxaloacetate decarboxylase beta subunit
MHESFSQFLLENIETFLSYTGFANASLGYFIMILVGLVFIFLAIRFEFEPMLLIPIGFGILIGNIPFKDAGLQLGIYEEGSVLNILYQGVKQGWYPPLIFLGIGAMTDFSALISNPKLMLVGAAAQFGIFGAYIIALQMGFDPAQAGAIGIIGGADGPTALFVTSKLAEHLLGPIAVAAYSYMALVPVIQPPIMKALTTKEERKIKMGQLRPVTKAEKIIFPIMVTTLVGLILPSTVPLLGMLMLGNLMKEAGVVDRICKTAQNELMNIVTIFLGLSVGATATAEVFLTAKTIKIMVLGVCAFACGTAGGVLLAKFMNLFRKEGNKLNPLIGSAGVSAVPMAARVSQTVGQKENPSNFLLMHAMGPNVAGVIGSAIAAGMLLSYVPTIM